MRDNGRTGYKKPEGVREQHQVRAYPAEWQLIKAFADIVKKGNKSAAIDFINQHKLS